MTSYHQQVLIDAPVEQVWELVGNPRRHPEWWKRIVDVKGDRFDMGDAYVQVLELPSGEITADFVVDRLADMREIRLQCQVTGTYAHWLLTPAQGGTFVDITLGIEPKSWRSRIWSATSARSFFRSWLDESIDSLRQATAKAAASPG